MGLIEEPTCDELICEADQKAAECFKKLVEGGSLQDITQMLRAFFTPDHAVDQEQLAWQNMMYLFLREPCGPAQGNNAEKRCFRVECATECTCGCPQYELQPTGCDDPDQCQSFSMGWNYTALARAAEYAVSLAYMPLRLRSLRTGDVLVWDADAIPDNKPCDPCNPVEYGAWVNRPSADISLAGIPLDSELPADTTFRGAVERIVDLDFISEVVQSGEHSSQENDQQETEQ